MDIYRGMVLACLIFLASLVSVELGISAAIIEIILGVLAGNFIHVQQLGCHCLATMLASSTNHSPRCSSLWWLRVLFSPPSLHKSTFTRTTCSKPRVVRSIPSFFRKRRVENHKTAIWETFRARQIFLTDCDRHRLRLPLVAA